MLPVSFLPPARALGKRNSARAPDPRAIYNLILLYWKAARWTGENYVDYEWACRRIVTITTADRRIAVAVMQIVPHQNGNSIMEYPETAHHRLLKRIGRGILRAFQKPDAD